MAGSFVCTLAGLSTMTFGPCGGAPSDKQGGLLLLAVCACSLTLGVMAVRRFAEAFTLRDSLIVLATAASAAIGFLVCLLNLYCLLAAYGALKYG